MNDNQKHRALFSLPAIKTSKENLPDILTLPPQEKVTGDKEIDALLWLRTVISRGDALLIEKAMSAAKKIKTPPDELEKRYRDYLIKEKPGNPFSAMSSFGFADLNSLATRAIEQKNLRIEGAARFGDRLLEDTEADAFCVETLKGLERSGTFPSYDKDSVADRFKAKPDLMPHTLADCLYELDYWEKLYSLRNAVDIYASDGPPESTARNWFVFGLMAKIPPRDREEARKVLRYLYDSERDDMEEARAIIENLVG